MPTSKKVLVLAVVLQAANVVKSASASLVERNSAVIIASKAAAAVGSVAETIARESDATIEVVISEAAMTAVHAAVVTALLLIQTVHAHVAGTVEQEVKIEVILAEKQQENEIRSTKLSCILGV